MLVGPKKNPVEILTPEDIAKLPQQEQHNVGDRCRTWIV